MADGFHTACPTCCCRLIVKDAALIGEILSCPKCGSMVLIEAPEGGCDTPGVDVASKSDTVDPETPQTAAPSADFQAHSGMGWLPIAAGGIASFLVAATIGWYAWHRSSDNEIAQFSPPERLIESAPAANEDTAPILPEEPSAIPEPASSNEPTAEQPVLSPHTASDSDTELVAPEIDPFDETDDTSLPTTLAEQVGPELDSPTLTDQDSLASDNSLVELASLLGGPVAPSNEDWEDTTPAQAADTFRPSASVVRTDVAKISQRPIREVRFERVPLIDFIRSLEQLTTIPIGIDTDALEVTGKGPDVAVSVSQTNASALHILQQALAPLGLQPKLSQHAITITTERLNDATTVSRKFFIGDLLAENFDCARFVATLVEPQSWTIGGGEGLIRNDGTYLQAANTRQVLVRVAVFLDRLRQARSLPGKNSLPSHMTTFRQPRWKSVRKRLAQPIDVHAWGESTFIDILSQIEQRANLRILVDWESLVETGIQPLSSAKLYIRNQPVETAIKMLVNQIADAENAMGLYPVSADTVQLTSQQRLKDSAFVDFYEFDRLRDTSQEVAQRLMLQGRAAIDPVSGVAVIGASAEVHRKLSQ